MKRDCLKKRVDDAKRYKNPNGGRLENGGDGCAPPNLALGYAASAGQARHLNAHRSAGSSLT